MVQNFKVNGMTCGSCAKHVHDAFLTLPGVTKAEVDVPSHNATVTSEAPLEVQAVTEALREAGYELAA